MRRERVQFLRYGIGGATLVLALTVGAVVASGSTGPSPKHASVVTITYRDKGSTVHLRVGERLRVVLDSTYWALNRSSNVASLTSLGAARVDPRLTGCVPGEGCGTVTESFRAIARGTAEVTASRVSCGEALRCTDGNGNFFVTIDVS
jgi:hypothetical protein